MNVSSTSSSSTVSASTVSVSTSGASTVSQLEQQLKTVQQEIQKENKSSDDATTKQKVIQALELEEEMIQMEIQQAQAKAAKGKTGQDGATQIKSADSSQDQTSSQSNASQLLDVVA